MTGAIPSFLILTGYWHSPVVTAAALIVFGVVVFVALWPLTSASWSPRSGSPENRQRPAH